MTDVGRGIVNVASEPHSYANDGETVAEFHR